MSLYFEKRIKLCLAPNNKGEKVLWLTSPGPYQKLLELYNAQSKLPFLSFFAGKSRPWPE